jgi:hypothetical protein
MTTSKLKAEITCRRVMNNPLSILTPSFALELNSSINSVATHIVMRLIGDPVRKKTGFGPSPQPGIQAFIILIYEAKNSTP